MPSPWDSVTEALSRLTQPIRSWGGRGVVSDYVVPPANKPISPVPQEQTVEGRGFISPLPRTPLQSSPQPLPSPSTQPYQQPIFPSLEEYGTPQPPDEIINLIMALFPKEEWANAARVAFGESSYNPGLTGPTDDRGLYQISPKWQSENLASQGYTIEDMMDMEKNMRFASWLQSQQGWNPWVAAKIAGIVPE